MKKNQKKHELESEMMGWEKDVIDKRNSLVNSLQQSHNDSRLSHSQELAKVDQSIADLKSKTDKNNLIKSMTLKEKSEIQKNVFEKAVSVCPTCYQEISEQIKEKLKNKVQELDSTSVALANENSKIETEIKAYVISKDDYIKKFNQEVEKFLQTINKVKEDSQLVMLDLKGRLSIACMKLDEIELSQIKLAEAEMVNEKSALPPIDDLLEEKKSLVSLIEKSKKIQSEISDVKSEVGTKKALLSYKQKEEFDESQIISNKQRLSKLHAHLAVLSQELADLEVKMKRYSIVKKMFSPTGIPSMLIDDSIPFINETVSKYLEQISGGRYIVSFDTVRETKGGDLRDKIGINVLDTVTLASSRSKLSGGQTRIIDIATILTLASLQSVMRDVKINLMLFDEIFDSLDDNNITYVARVLKTVTTDKAIFIISHRHIDLIEADEVIRLEG